MLSYQQPQQQQQHLSEPSHPPPPPPPPCSNLPSSPNSPSLHPPLHSTNLLAIRAFDTIYLLNKARVISNSAFFHALLIPQSLESIYTKEANCNMRFTGNINFIIDLGNDFYELPFTDSFPCITKKSFELMMKRMDGHPDPIKEGQISTSEMKEAADYFGVDIEGSLYNDIVSSLKQLTLLEESVKSHETKLRINFIRNGWKLDAQDWDIFSFEETLNILQDAEFYVPNEYHHAVLLINLIERRKRIHDKESIDSLKKLLNEDVDYTTIPINKLLKLKESEQINGFLIQGALDGKHLSRKVILRSERRIADTGNWISSSNIPTTIKPCQELIPLNFLDNLH